MMPVNSDLAIFSSLIGVSGYIHSTRVWLQCQAIIGISVLAGFFANPVKYTLVCSYPAIIGMRCTYMTLVYMCQKIPLIRAVEVRT